MAIIEVDDETHALLDFAARTSNRSKGDVVAQLVNEWSGKQRGVLSSRNGLVEVSAVYHKEIVEGVFDPGTSSLTVLSSPWNGEKFKSPSAAARAVIENLRPGVNSNRNGWTFWMVRATRLELDSLRGGG